MSSPDSTAFDPGIVLAHSHDFTAAQKGDALVRAMSQSIAGVWSRIKYDPAVRMAGFVFLLSRLIVFFVLILTTHLVFKESPQRFGAGVQDVRIAVRRYSIPEHLRNLAMRSDGSWYISLARNGYDKEPFNLDKEHNWAFFPLYPLTIRFFASLTGQYRLTAIALSNLFLFLALILLHKTVTAFGYERSVANRTLFYLAIFPTSYFLSLPWTTALFLLVTVGAFWAAKTKRWWLAGVFAGLASATRYNGSFILPALVILYWQENGWFRFKRDFLWLLLAPTGLLAFMAYLYWLTGNALAFADAQAAWNVRWGIFLEPLFTFIISPFELSTGWNFRLVNFLAAMLALACSVLMIRRREYAWGFYTVISVLVPLSTVTLEGQTRYVISLFPVFVMLALLGRSRQIDQIIYTVFITLLVMMTAFFGFYLSPAMI